MSEDVKQEEPIAVEPHKPKLFLLMVDEIGMTFLGKVIPGISYVEVQGMDMKDCPGYQCLVNPKLPVVEAAKPVAELPSPTEVEVV